MTTFASALRICGLSLQEAADYFDVRLDTVKSWSAGRNPAPDGVWMMLADLWQRIENAADFASADLDPSDKAVRQNLSADNGLGPLPGSAAEVAGAMALLFSMLNDQDPDA